MDFAHQFAGNQGGLTNSAGQSIPTQISNATNGLGNAAYTASTAYDPSGAAQNATNGLNSAEIQAKIGAGVYDTSGAGTTAAFNATNALNAAAFTGIAGSVAIANVTTPGTIVTNGATLSITHSNNLAVDFAHQFAGNQGGLTNSAGQSIPTQISNATNGLGNAALRASAYDASGTALNATNGLNSAEIQAKIGAGMYDVSGAGATAAQSATNPLSALAYASVGSGLQLAGGTLSSTAGNGTVTSVGLLIPGFTIANSPVTGSGTLTATPAGAVLTNGQSTATTFSNSVTISSGVSTTNHFGGANGFDSANGANFTNIPSSAVNGLGSAALQASSAFDAAGAGTTAALNATNGLTSRPTPSPNRAGVYDANNAAHNATNGLTGAQVTALLGTIAIAGNSATNGNYLTNLNAQALYQPTNVWLTR